MQAAADQEQEAAEEEEGAGKPASLEDQAEAPSSEPRRGPSSTCAHSAGARRARAHRHALQGVVREVCGRKGPRGPAQKARAS